MTAVFGKRSTVGVDLGGSWLRLRLVRDGRARTIRRPAVRWTELPRALERELRALGLRRVDRLAVGSTGLGLAADRRRLARRLAPLARRVRVLTDFDLAHRAAFAGGPGILVIGGTGSVAFGRAERGPSARAGGLGPLLGDEGSAFWIGREALRRRGLRERLPDANTLAHAERPVRAVAGLAPRVLRWAAEGHGPAARLRGEAAAELAALADALRRVLGFRGPAPVCWHGGLFRDEGMRRAFVRELRRRGRFAPRTPRLSATEAASRL